MSRADSIDINADTADEIDDVRELRGHGFEIVPSRLDRVRFDALRQLEEVPGLARKVAVLAVRSRRNLAAR